MCNTGGHTKELLTVAGDLNFAKYPIRTWVSFAGDSLSVVRAMELEQKKTEDQGTAYRASPKKAESVSTVQLPRARVVGQSYFTSIFTTLFCALYCIYSVFKVRPDIVRFI